jgi:hypothetical protein
MKILIDCKLFAVLLVIGKVWDVRDDQFQTTCLRVAWRGRPVLRLGPPPTPATNATRPEFGMQS